jgi:hypothetical protein
LPVVVSSLPVEQQVLIVEAESASGDTVANDSESLRMSKEQDELEVDAD